MKLLVQRVISAECVATEPVAAGRVLARRRIGRGLLVYVAVGSEDAAVGRAECEHIVERIYRAKIFSAEAGGGGRLARSLAEHGELMLISQITLYGRFKGTRPDFSQGAPLPLARALMAEFIHCFRACLGRRLQCGIFGAHMEIHAQLSGPVTFLF